MANSIERCPVCSGVIALIGIRHNCVPRITGPVPALKSAGAIPQAADEASPTYRYRDPEVRRAYMRDYMKRKRAKKSSGAS